MQSQIVLIEENFVANEPLEFPDRPLMVKEKRSGCTLMTSVRWEVGNLHMCSSLYFQVKGDAAMAGIMPSGHLSTI